MWVLDATPLTYLAKVDRLGVIDHLDGQRAIPEVVYDEVVADGLEAGYPDARRVERSIESGTLETVATEETALLDRLRENPNLSDADAAVLACAEERDGTAVTDETYGRNVADAEGIATRGTAYIVLSAAKTGPINPDAARETIDGMIDAGWYCAPDVYAEIVEKVESLAD
jgi:predicted nucleic acid-binding protein